MNNIEKLRKIADGLEDRRVSLLNTFAPAGLIETLNSDIEALTTAIADMERMEYLEERAKLIEAVDDRDIYDMHESPQTVREAISAAMKEEKE